MHITTPVRDQRGMMTIQYVAATGFTLVLLVLTANLLVDLYARGAVREALDEGMRVATRAGGTAETCRERADEVLDTLLRGPIGDGIAVECSIAGGWVEAGADVTLRSWLPGVVPDWSFRVRAAGVQERA